MQLSVIRAKINTDGVDISGEVVAMAAGTTHIVRTKDLPYYQQHSDAFEVVSATPALLLTDANGHPTSLVGPDGTEYEIINDISELIPEYTPSASASAGVTGTITRDASYLYVCTATNTWERVAIATW